MKIGTILTTLLVAPMFVFSAWALIGLEPPLEPLHGSIMAEPYFSGVEKVWDATSSGDASGVANWDPVGVPQTGDNVTFDGTSTYNCNWNIEVALGNFSMLTGYSGVVTQSADYSCVNWTGKDGTFTGDADYILTVEGDFKFYGGSATLTAGKLRLKMTGDDTDLYVVGVGWFMGLQISANVTCTAGLYMNYQGATYLTVDTGRIFTITTNEFRLYSTALGATLTNNGTIAGSASFTLWVAYDSPTITFGVVTAPVKITCSSASEVNRVVTLGAAHTAFASTLQVNSEDDTFTMELNHGTGNTLAVTGTVTLGTRGIMTQGAGAWSFGSYTQSGAGSLFTQGAALTVGGDFTISDGEFVNDGDMITVSGDWDTDGYTHGDNVVTLTGASKTLDMAATESFYNITVSGTYTMDADTTVDLRATITGTVSGSGDFIEPEPEFTSEGVGVSCPGVLYEYDVTQAYWDALAIYDAPYWLHIVGGIITGVPLENDTGVHQVSLTLIWNDMTTYQNYTLIVCPDPLSEVEIAILGVVLSVVLGFGLLAIGITRNEPIMTVYSGLIWVFSGIIVYKDINLGWAIISMCLGMLFLWTGGLQIGKDSES